MKKFVVIFLILGCLLQIFGPVTAFAADCSALSASQGVGNAEPYSGTAEAVVLYELSSETMVYTHNADVRINPTGLVKLLTALIALEKGNLSDKVTVTRSAINSVGVGVVSVGLKAGEQLTLEDLLYCIMVSSANDACAVVAEHIAGSQAEFVKLMNERAATMGCAGSHFTNVHGLADEKQYSTARDLAIITENAIKNETFLQMFGTVKYQVPATNAAPGRTLSTTNYMMDKSRSKYYDDRVIGGKPAAATTRDRSMICLAQAQDSRYLCVVISAQAQVSGNSVTKFTNFLEAGEWLDFGFSGFERKQVTTPERSYGIYPVTGGENYVSAVPASPVYALLPLEYDASKLWFDTQMVESALVAPLAQGVKIGTLRVCYEDLVLGEAELISRHSVAEADSRITAATQPQRGIGAVGILLIVAGLAAACAVVFFILRYKSLKMQNIKQA